MTPAGAPTAPQPALAGVRRDVRRWLAFGVRLGLLISVSVPVGLLFGADVALRTAIVLLVLGVAFLPGPRSADVSAVDDKAPVFAGFPTTLFYLRLYQARHRVRIMDPYLHLLARPAQLNRPATARGAWSFALAGRANRIILPRLLRRAVARGVEVEVLVMDPNTDYLPSAARSMLYTTGVRYRQCILDGLADLARLRDRLPDAGRDRLAVRMFNGLTQHSYYLADDQVLMSYSQSDDQPTFAAKWYLHHCHDSEARMAAYVFESCWGNSDGFRDVVQFGTEAPAALEDILPVEGGVPRRFTETDDPFCSKGFDGCACAWARYPDGQGGYIARRFRHLYQGPVAVESDGDTLTVVANADDGAFDAGSLDPALPGAARWRPEVKGADQ